VSNPMCLLHTHNRTHERRTPSNPSSYYLCARREARRAGARVLVAFGGELSPFFLFFYNPCFFVGFFFFTFSFCDGFSRSFNQSVPSPFILHRAADGPLLMRSTCTTGLSACRLVPSLSHRRLYYTTIDTVIVFGATAWGGLIYTKATSVRTTLGATLCTKMHACTLHFVSSRYTD
jgi:hypothetical protein